MKKILISLLIFTMSLMAVGCKSQDLPSDSLFLQLGINSYGGVSQSLGFPTMENELSSYYPQEKIEVYKQDLKASIETKIYNAYYLKYLINYVKAPIENYQIGGEYVKFNSPQLEDERVVFSFNFLNSNAWNLYNNSQVAEQSPSSPDLSFISTVEVEKDFPFTEKDANGNFLGSYYSQLIKDSILKHFPNFDLNQLEFVFEYRYFTPYSRLHSNADLIVKNGEGSLHSWLLSERNFQENKLINISIKEANKGVWYLTVLISFLVISLFVLITCHIKNKKSSNTKKNR